LAALILIGGCGGRADRGSSGLVSEEESLSVHQHPATTPTSTNGGEESALREQLDALAVRYGNRFLHEPAPDNALPERGMRAVDAMRLIGEELVLDGISMLDRKRAKTGTDY
jgi:hypothetical protein